MQQLQAILHAAALEFVHQPNEFRNGQTELRTLAAGFEPAPGAARRELHAYGQTRHLIRAVGERHQLLELGTSDDRQHLLAEQLRRQDQRQDDVIFHAVAQQQSVVADAAALRPVPFEPHSRPRPYALPASSTSSTTSCSWLTLIG